MLRLPTACARDRRHEASLAWGQAVAVGVLCNALVCLAVWLSYAVRSGTDKVLAVIFPITP